jgi:LuxR family maltose regulon positive regulatory protein
MSKVDFLLKTKFIKPAPRKNMLHRNRLLDPHLNNLTNNEDSSFLHRLILISAPAGYGKTTIVSSWLEKRGPAAWLTIGEADNDPNRFWLYFASALYKNYNIGRSMLSILESGSIPVDYDTDNDIPYEEALVLLINELADMNKPASLVLDDYHHIDDGHISSGLQFLVENFPPNFQLIIISRTDPPLPLARWRSKGWMFEVRQKDLCFNLDETTQLMKKNTGYDLSAKQVEILYKKTEGWATSLAIIASIISTRQDLDKEAFIKDLNQSCRYLLDYLSEEILDQQDPEIINFLLNTSILEYLTPRACGVLTCREDAGMILHTLEAENLFIVSLDHAGKWYRYHHLFAEMLRRRLVTEKGREKLSSLHMKAAAWFAEECNPSGAVSHALKAEDFEFAAYLLEQNIAVLFNRGEQKNLTRWIQQIPPKIIEKRPRLLTFLSMLVYLSGDTKMAEETLEKARPLINGSEFGLQITENSDQRELQGIYHAVRAYLRLFSGDVVGMSQDAEKALAKLPEKDSMWQSNLLILSGDIAAISGNLNKAVDIFAEALAVCRRANNHFFTLMAGFKQARIFHYQGRLTEADQLCLELLDEAEDSGFTSTARAGCLHIIRGMVAYERNRLDESLNLAQRGFKLIEREGFMLLAGWAYCCLAAICLARRDLQEASAMVRQAENCGLAGELPYIENLAAAWKARLRLLESRQDPAILDDTIEMLLKRNLFPDRDLEGAIDFFRIDEYTALARVLIARGHRSEAEKFLPSIQQIAEKESIVYLLAEVLLLRATAAFSNNNIEDGYMYFREALEKCGSRIQQEGIKRLFLNEGKVLVKLLHRARKEALFPELTSSLLSAVEKTSKPLVQAISESAAEDEQLIEELSDRELEILELINAGLTNQDISSRLYISLNTVKWHLKNIYGKLTVDNRAAAAARARSLRLIQ